MLVVLVLVVRSRQPSFLSVPSLRVLLESAAPIMLLALGQMFVILIGGIDLSIAVLASFGTVLLAKWLPGMGVLGVLAMLVTLSMAGALNGFISAYLQVPSFIVTLGAMGLWSGVALTVSGASTLPLREGYDAIGWLKDLRFVEIPASGVLALVVVLVTAVLMRTLSAGRALHAMGLAERAVLMSGGRTLRLRVLAFTLSGLCAGLAAVVLGATQFSGAPTLANALLLPAIAAVVVGGSAITGGVGGPVRTLIGTLVIGVLRVGLNISGVDPAYEQVVYGVVIIAAVALTLDRSRMKVVK
ncbi:ABC transporter permease [Dactylosporangium sp. NPDC005572]|uniref:ABC transporter permease n=1 Tax=Dactylosporangium sp. NPDC005572 TaxID=3156889 RepID=UPI0033A3D237